MESLTAVLSPAAAATAPIEHELVLITPVGKSLSEPALGEFTKYARERRNIEIKTSALSAGTLIASGRTVEWNG